jgi:hypothetical protein
MTYPELVTSLYAEYPALMPLWRQSASMAGEPGVFVFFPESYGALESFQHVKFEFWSASRLGEFLRKRGGTDEGFRELAEQIDHAKEFLVFIQEPPDPDGRRPVHIHRIGAVAQN